MKFLLLIFKNLRRNLLRTALTALGTMVLVCVVTLVWSILYFLDKVTAEKSQNLKAIVTERWQIPSQMPFAYATSLTEGAARNAGDVRPVDAMTWQFYGGSIDREKRTRENIIFAFALEPKKLASMMDDLDELPRDQAAQLQEVIRKVEGNKQAIVVGRERLEAMNKRVGERITVYSFNYRDIDLEFDIVGTFPEGRYNQSAAMNRDYLNDALDRYPLTHAGKPHPMAARSLNLVWLRMNNLEMFQKVAGQITSSPLYSTPAVKCETASSAISSFMESYRDIIWGMRWLLAPAILVTLSLIISNAISISVRERRAEMAVLKVLGFRPGHLLFLVLGEALLIGTLAGLVSAGGTYFIVNDYFGGLKFPIAFFPEFFVPIDSLGWGLGIGVVTALAGSIVPAWTARSVRVSDVFAKVT